MRYLWDMALLILLGVLCAFLNTVTAEPPLVPALLGINLGSTHITAATINGSGTISLALFEGSNGYLAFVKNATDPELSLEDYYQEAFDIMKQVLNDVRIKASSVYKEELRIGAILAPEHFTWETRRLVSSSWTAVNKGVFVQPVRPVSYSAVIYPENNCVDRLFNAMLPEDEGEWVLVFHQDFDYLSVSLSEVTTYLYDTTSQSLAIPNTADDIADALRSVGRYGHQPYIAAIVLSSHNHEADFQLVREALDQVDVQLWNRRKNSTLDLEYIAAAGAACMARQNALFPIPDHDCRYHHPDDEETIPPFLHTEL